MSFPAIQPPAETPFKCYAHKKSRKDKERGDTDPTAIGVTVAAETDDMEFVTNADETKEVEGAGCKCVFCNPLGALTNRYLRYMIAVHNKRTGTTELLPMSVPVHIVKQNVKALKSAMVDTEKPAGTYQVARTALGESFGTKKAKASIRAAERNKVDVAAMKGAMDHVMDGIEKGAGGLPTKGAFICDDHHSLTHLVQMKPRRKQTQIGSFPHTMKMRSSQQIYTHYRTSCPRTNGKPFLSVLSSEQRTSRRGRRCFPNEDPNGSMAICEKLRVCLPRSSRKSCVSVSDPSSFVANPFIAANLRTMCPP